MDNPSFEHRLLHVLAQKVPHRIYAKDTAGRFTFANDAAARGMGVTDPSQLLGKTDFDFHPLEDARDYFACEQALMHSGQAVLDAEEHVRYLKLDQEAWLITTKIPLRDDTGEIVGLVGINCDITAQKQSEHALRAAHLQAAAVAHQLQETVAKLDLEMRERQRFEQELQQRALHDTLTGLPNRSLLMDRLAHCIDVARQDERSLSLLCIDIDRFKVVNDSLGHASGDELLKVLTHRIAQCVRTSDTFARLGGDEFVLLLPGMIAPDMLTGLTERIRRIVEEPVRLGGQDVSVTCSLGCSVYPQDGADAVELLKCADAAMHSAKEQGGNTIMRYTRELDPHANERLEIETQLKQALQREEFILHYQPQVDLATGRIVGVEALVRWQHPVRGLVSPLSFIPIAEESGLIGPIGEWVLRAACAQAVAWQRDGLGPLRMSVNLSARQFLNPALESLVSEVLEQSGLDPHLLELELTESVSMKNPEETIRILGTFKALGISVAIDDFGTGYSNLAYLRRFPVDRIKLDRAFINELTGQASSHAIVEAIVAMARKLELETVAEGVETIEQRDHLVRFGCDMMQGYWFSRPLAPTACEALLRKTLSTPDAATV